MQREFNVLLKSWSNAQRGRLLVATLVVAIVAFAALVAGVTGRSRGAGRAEVLRREAEPIQAGALMQLGAEFVAVPEASRLRGVQAVQLLDTQARPRQAKPLAPDELHLSFPSS